MTNYFILKSQSSLIYYSSEQLIVLKIYEQNIVFTELILRMMTYKGTNKYIKTFEKYLLPTAYPEYVVC